MGFNLSLSFPEVFNDFVGIFDVFNLSLLDLLAVDCWSPHNYGTALVLTTLIPLSIAAVLVGVFQKLPKGNPNRPTVFQAFLVLTFLVLPSCSSIIFHTFKCTEFHELEVLDARPSQCPPYLSRL